MKRSPPPDHSIRVTYPHGSATPVYTVAVFAFLGALSGCAQTLPPHVRLPITHVERADLYYWRDTGLCTLAIVAWPRRVADDPPVTLQFSLDPSVCRAWAQADGVDVGGQP